MTLNLFFVSRRYLIPVLAATLWTLSLPQVQAKPKTSTPKAPQYPELLKVGDMSRIAPRPRDQVIGFALYTVQKGVLKLSAHLYPLQKGESQEVTLEVMRNGTWTPLAKAPVHPIGWTAVFRVTGWDQSQNVRYRVRHAGGSVYEGLIRRDPVDKTTIVAAVFTGNSPGPGGGKISKQDVVDNVTKIDPDVLVFTGDQVYSHTTHTASWLEFGKTFGDIMRCRPTITIPDDHDAGQPNLWGDDGRKVNRDTKGGYTRPAEYVKLIQRQQASHLPDPYDPTPIKQGIGVYYTSLNVGGIDMAILEDRKFKSGCYDLDLVGKGLGNRPDWVTKPGVNPKQFDVPGKKLLGDRQLKFLHVWGQNWNGAVMKAVVSQTVFAMASTGGAGTKNNRYTMDFDADGWPQTGRDKAVDAMRRCFAFHMCGDQHLATIGQYGIDDWRDSGWWFCVPSIANLYPRWWKPQSKSPHPIAGPLDNLGDYLEGFGNKITMYAYANPHKTGRQPAELLDRMPGFGIVRFNKAKRTIKMECWPRMVDPTDPKSKQYTGWPRTIKQTDNYGRKAVAWLPTIITDTPDPVVQVVDESNHEVLYTLRIAGMQFRPKVFKAGLYTVKVGEGAKMKTFKGIKSIGADDKATLEPIKRSKNEENGY